MPESPTQPFSGIFVSYRRDDTSGHAGRLFDKLADHFGKDRIFMDIDTIKPGEDFVTVIENAVGSCEILIAVIGRNWLSGTAGAARRLNDPNDFVRVEIVTALRRDIRVIPVLVHGAAMPKPQDLPDDLSGLSRRHALELSDLRWQRDVDTLISTIEKTLVEQDESRQNREAATQHRPEEKPPSREREAAETTPRRRDVWMSRLGKPMVGIIVAGLVVVGLIAGVLFSKRSEGHPDSGTANSTLAENQARVVEVAYWNSVREKDVKELEAYLKKYPNGEFKDLANIRLAKLGTVVSFDSVISDSNRGVLSDVEKGRLDNFAAALKEVGFAQGYIMVYGSRSGPRDQAQVYADYAKNYLVTARDIDASRLVLLDAGLREKLTTELWIVPQGASPPIP